MGTARTLTVALCVLPLPALADPCDAAQPVPRPIGIGLAPADFATTPGPCAATRAALGGRATLLVDEPDFYGTLQAEVLATGTYAFSDALWLSAAWSAIDYRFVQNATLVAEETSLGPATIGLHLADPTPRERFRLSPFVRALLPTDTLYRYAIRGGLEPGVSLLFLPTSKLALLVGGSTPVMATTLGQRVHWAFAARVSADASYRLTAWFEPLLGLEARVGAAPDVALEAVSLAGAARFHFLRSATAEIAGLFPLFGADRTDSRLLLLFGWTF